MMRSNHLRSIPPRCAAVVVAQNSRWAISALLIAVWKSSSVQLATSPSTVPVEGSADGKSRTLGEGYGFTVDGESLLLLHPLSVNEGMLDEETPIFQLVGVSIIVASTL